MPTRRMPPSVTPTPTPIAALVETPPPPADAVVAAVAVCTVESVELAVAEAVPPYEYREKIIGGSRLCSRRSNGDCGVTGCCCHRPEIRE
jgi:hypothetical protein